MDTESVGTRRSRAGNFPVSMDDRATKGRLRWCPRGAGSSAGKWLSVFARTGSLSLPKIEGRAETHFLMGPGAASSERATAQVTADLAGLAVLAARRKPAVRFALTARTGRTVDCVSDVGSLSPLDPRGCSGWGSRRASVVTRWGIRTGNGRARGELHGDGVHGFGANGCDHDNGTRLRVSPPRVVHCHVCDGGKVSSVIGHQNRIGKQSDEMKTEKRIAATSSVDRADWRNFLDFPSSHNVSEETVSGFPLVREGLASAATRHNRGRSPTWSREGRWRRSWRMVGAPLPRPAEGSRAGRARRPSRPARWRCLV